MTARLVRAALLVVIAAAAMVSTVVAADPPTLGARLSPAEYIVGRDEAVSITNRSTVPVSVHVDAAGDGWAVDVSDFTLAVDEERSLTVTAGQGEAAIRATLAAIDVVGVDATALVLETSARHPSPWESVPSLAWLLLLVGGFLILYAIRRRFLRRSQ